MTETEHLRVLIANEKRDRLELLAQVVAGLGHEVIAREIYVKEVGAVTAREQPDVALVGLGSSSEHALELISEIVREAACPVIAILHAGDPTYIHEAAKRGVFAYIIDGTPDELQSAIDITLKRFAEYQSLQHRSRRRREPPPPPAAAGGDRKRLGRRRGFEQELDLIVDIRGGAGEASRPDGLDDVFLRVWAVYEAGGLLAACAWCGRVRIDGKWLVPPRAALAAIDTRNVLSHSICGECAEAARPFGAGDRHRASGQRSTIRYVQG